jgi:hypothetical protein
MATLSPVLEWVMGIVALLVMAGLIYRVIGLVPAGRLMRCPETGTFTFVEIVRASRGDGTEPKVTVQSCGLWPQHDGCRQRCLVSRNWGQVHISEPGAKYIPPHFSLDTCI